MNHADHAALARRAALGMASLLLACSSSAHPPGELPGTSVDGSIKDGAGDSNLPDRLATGDAEPSDVSAEGSATSDDSSSDGETSTPEEAAAYGPDSGPYIDSGPPVALPATSCATSGPGLSDCGPEAGSCCASPAVIGADFSRSFDSVTSGATTQSAPASVNDFRLDQYEITVGRFRKFVAAAVSGWTPAPGSGKHIHLNSGNGVADSSAQGRFEAGWDASWNGNIATAVSSWDTNLECGTNSNYSWTSLAGIHEDMPITCVSWYEAYAFCIWDNGFLPSETEWNFAASGGGDQRVYPWSSPPTSQSIDCSYANYYGASGGTDFCVSVDVGQVNSVGSEAPKGDGKWGHSDLAGNAWEWTLDDYAPYGSPCTDCAYLAGTTRVIRGGGFGNPASFQTASARNSEDPTFRGSDIGARCARVP